jgi:uncharacterized protein YndB with AHSA1/START domain
MELKFEFYVKMKKSIAEVFDAVYNPKKLGIFFANGGTSGPLDEGKSVTWKFTEFPCEFGVNVNKVIKNERIVFEWTNTKTTKALLTEMIFEALDSHSTRVRIKESGWNKENQESLDESYSHCKGWMQMLCCLKVYVEDGKNLREFFY